jgi:hypothetical protein
MEEEVCQWESQSYGVGVSSIDMYNNDVGKGGARVYEAYEVK